mmetsp:Transcript_31248/g.56727  ORF Transcript_31248/g.56727 Transcript_31248/m.56727 type:complete len:224 (+) Transcript_31248:717-1388(+)
MGPAIPTCPSALRNAISSVAISVSSTRRVRLTAASSTAMRSSVNPLWRRSARSRTSVSARSWISSVRSVARMGTSPLLSSTRRVLTLSLLTCSPRRALSLFVALRSATWSVSNVLAAASASTPWRSFRPSALAMLMRSTSTYWVRRNTPSWRVLPTLTPAPSWSRARTTTPSPRSKKPRAMVSAPSRTSSTTAPSFPAAPPLKSPWPTISARKPRRSWKGAPS